MTFTNQHKALLITLLIAGTVVLGVFNAHLSQKTQQLAETVYDLDPEPLTEEEEKEIFEQEEEQPEQVTTNEAYNTTQNYKRFAQAYKLIEPPKDYVPSRQTETQEVSEQAEDVDNTVSETSDAAINSEMMESYNRANSVLMNHSSKHRNASASNGDNSSKDSALNSGVNKNSSANYSLKDRTHINLPTPIYLCERGGKVIVNIKVNGQGVVTDATINGRSKSVNECLKEHGIEYALQSRFNTSSKPSQIGTITFYFKGK